MASNTFDINLVVFKNYISNDLLDQENYAQLETIILKYFIMTCCSVTDDLLRLSTLMNRMMSRFTSLLGTARSC